MEFLGVGARCLCPLEDGVSNLFFSFLLNRDEVRVGIEHVIGILIDKGNVIEKQHTASAFSSGDLTVAFF